MSIASTLNTTKQIRSNEYVYNDKYSRRYGGRKVILMDFSYHHKAKMETSYLHELEEFLHALSPQTSRKQNMIQIPIWLQCL